VIGRDGRVLYVGHLVDDRLESALAEAKKSATPRIASSAVGDAPPAPHAYAAKTRYRQTDAQCTLLRVQDDRCEIDFEQPQRAITPGQSVVVYDGDVCLGGGIIE